jgi:Protein of unknown function (DUF4012)
VPSYLTVAGRLSWRQVVLACFALVIIASVFEVVSLALASRDSEQGASVLTGAARSLGTSPAQWSTGRVADAESRRSQAQALLQPARSRIKGDPVLRLAAELPFVGDQVRALLDLTDAADTSSAVLRDYLEMARKYAALRGQQGPSGPKLIRLLRDWLPPLSDADARLHVQLARLRRDQSGWLLPPMRDRVGKAVDVLSPATDQTAAAAAAARLVPTAIGAEGSKQYLLVFANPAEIRPAGGYAGAVGSVTVLDGAIQRLDIRPEDAYTPLLRQVFVAPGPLPRFFNYKKVPFGIGEAGWDPNFPNSARLAESMFKSATGSDVDGTLSIDPYAISAMLSVTGPVHVPGYGTFDATSFFPEIDFLVNVKRGPGSGKQALPVIAKAILERVLTLTVSDWPRLAKVFQQQAGGRHIQMYFHQADLASATRRAKYDGSVLTAGDDYAMVVDANVGVTKSDYYMTKAMDIKAEVPASGLSRHEITLRYTLPMPVDDIDRALNTEDQGAYADYVRVYLPELASGVSVRYAQDDGPGFGGYDRTELVNGKQVVSAFFRLPRGHQATLQIDYFVPLDARNRTFDLFIQKQAGIPDRPTTLELSFPGGRTTRRSSLSTDAEFQVSW